jgi:hypothetical protein
MNYNILVKTSSVLAFLEATRTEPEFWKRRRLMEPGARAKAHAPATESDPCTHIARPIPKRGKHT